MPKEEYESELIVSLIWRNKIPTYPPELRENPENSGPFILQKGVGKWFARFTLSSLQDHYINNCVVLLK